MRCPGQDSRNWKPDAIFEVPCGNCGESMEFFKDESVRKCKKCGNRMVNPKMDFGCAAYCKYAEQCLGGLSPELLSQRKELFKDRVPMEVKRYLKGDVLKIPRAIKVARYAEEILKGEKADLAVVVPAAYLLHIGILEAEKKKEKIDPASLAREGPPVAREILQALDADESLTNEICRIISRQDQSGAEETMDFQVVLDAEKMVSLEEQIETGIGAEELRGQIASFLTDAGRRLAGEVLLPRDKP
ncbi:MAG: hypothetical protein QMD32_08600 [Smithellaceae bacterium]|nr:hypothetical protein [Smithellaceae bacterium]